MTKPSTHWFLKQAMAFEVKLAHCVKTWETWSSSQVHTFWSQLGPSQEKDCTPSGSPHSEHKKSKSLGSSLCADKIHEQVDKGQNLLDLLSYPQLRNGGLCLKVRVLPLNHWGIKGSRQWSHPQSQTWSVSWWHWMSFDDLFLLGCLRTWRPPSFRKS